MGKLVVSENVTLDAVMQDPTGEEGFRYGGWFTQVSDADRAAISTAFLEEAVAADALLMGRRSYEWFATRWTQRTGEWAERLAALPKYVVSSSPADAGWGDTTVVGLDEVPKLKDQIDGDIVLYGSGRLVPTLLTEGLIDEVRLLVFPYALGSGDRLFGPSTGRTALRLTGNRTIGESIVALTYEVRTAG
jgi:dihydrofolate reductase